MEGIRDTLRDAFEKLKRVVRVITRARARVEDQRRQLEIWSEVIQAMPDSGAKSKAFRLWSFAAARMETRSRDVGKLEKKRDQFFSVLQKVRRALGLSRLGVAIVIPLVAIAAVLLAASKLLDVLVSDQKRLDIERQEIELIASGKVTPAQIEKLRKARAGSGGGFLTKAIKPLIAIAAVALLAPTILGAVRNR